MTCRPLASSLAPILSFCALSALACDDEPAPRQPPPPPPAATAAACEAPAKVNDPKNVAYFPSKVGGFCLDPNGSDNAYGEGADKPLDAICNLFDGECEIYKRHDVQRVVEARYVDGSGSGATIDVYLSQYGSSRSAYAMFTKRVVGDGDPAHPDTPDPLEAAGTAALGIGNAYLWKGPHLVEVTYNDSGAASAKEVEKKADALLPPLVKAFGEKLPGKAELPTAVSALPERDRLDLGVRYLTEEVLGVEGTGSGAYGYYADGDVRWRVVVMIHADEDRAEDVLRTLAKLAGAAKEKRVGDEAVRFIISDRGPKAEWLIARKGAKLIGIGDENRVLREGMSPEEHRKKTLSQEGKRKKLKALLAP